MLLSALQSLDVSPDVSENARSPAGAQAGLLYRAGRWDQAHQMAQDLETPEGSFWHGILHRHEEDWGNAGYWFRRVGKHAVYSAIYEDARAIMQRNSGSRWQLGTEWNPLKFIGWCEEAVKNSKPRDQAIVTEIQVAEWRRLFDWCNA